MRVTKIDVTSVGTSYTSSPTVEVTGGGGSGCTAVAVLTGDKVTSVVVTSGGANYTSAPAVAFSGGGGSSVIALASVG